MAIADLLMRSMPLGFRFRPSDVELVDHYLKGKILGRLKAEDDVIAVIDVCKCEPWDLPDRSLIKLNDPEWFFFAPKDRKYPTGQRANRATKAGYWKATGKDRLIKSRLPGQRSTLIGTKKTLVFHQGRAPKGMRTCWIMHEYRTTEPEYESGKEGGFVLCRLFKKFDDSIKASDIDECTENNGDEIESSVISAPTQSVSFPADAQNGTEIVVQPLNQSLPKQEPLQSAPLTANAHPSQVISLSEGDGDCVTSYPSKTVEGSCSDTLPSDNDATGTEDESLLSDIASYMDQDYDKFCPSDFNKVHSFGNSFMDYSFPEGFSEGLPLNFLQNNPIEQEDFLDTSIYEPGEFYHGESDVNVDSILSCLQDVDNPSLESVLAKKSITLGDVSPEVTAVQYTGDLVDEGFGTTAYSKNASQANNYICRINESYSQFAVLPTEYLSRSISFVGADVDALHQEPQAPKLACASKTTDALNNDITGTVQVQVNNNLAAVEVRTRQSLIAAENTVTHQGLATRRLRLQKVVKHDKSHVKQERSVPECISSNIEGKSSSHADIHTEKMKNVSPPKRASGSKCIIGLVVPVLAILFVVLAASRFSFS